MAKFRVHFEASAAIGVEVEIEADDEDAAKHAAERLYDRRELKLGDIVDELLKPSQAATDGYVQASGQPIKYITVEEDEAGFEIVDVFTAESIE